MRAIAGALTNNASVTSVLWLAFAALCAVLSIFSQTAGTLDFNIVISLAILALVVVSRLIQPLGIFRIFLLLLSAFILVRYLTWRATETISFADPGSTLVSVSLLGAELYASLMFLLSIFQCLAMREYHPVSVPLAEASYPTVDVMIPTYNEDVELVRITVLAATMIRYPADKLRVYVLDDGGTLEKRTQADWTKAAAAQARHEALQALCRDLGAHYLTRANNRHAKAGNLNEALKVTRGDLILMLDADHVPTEDILVETVGHMIENPKLFLVQTPHFFINPDPIEKNLGTFEHMPSENELFYHQIQRGFDFWGGSYFCGSAALMRRRCLNEIGGVGVQTITEDAETALALHARGYESLYVPKPMVAGLAAETFAAFIAQRLRWTQGMLQLLLLRCPLFVRGLKLPQRLCYLSACLYWLFPVARLIFLTAPVAFLIFDLQVVNASGEAFIAYVAPCLITLYATAHWLFGRFRWILVSEIYETVQSLFCLKAIWTVLVNPRAPSFVVTPKGELLDEDFISPLARPFHYVIAILLVAEVMGVARYLGDSLEKNMILITLFWNSVSILLLIAALGVVYEKRQRRASPRAPRGLHGELILPGATVEMQAEDVSPGGCLVMADGAAASHLAVGDRGQIRFFGIIGLATVPVTIRSVRPHGEYLSIGLQFASESIEDMRAAVCLVYGRSRFWRRFLESRTRSDAVFWPMLFLLRRSLQSGFRHLGNLIGDAVGGALRYGRSRVARAR